MIEQRNKSEPEWLTLNWACRNSILNKLSWVAFRRAIDELVDALPFELNLCWRAGALLSQVLELVSSDCQQIPLLGATYPVSALQMILIELRSAFENLRDLDVELDPTCICSVAVGSYLYRAKKKAMRIHKGILRRLSARNPAEADERDRKMENESGQGSGGRRSRGSKGEAVEKIAYTQARLDAAIREYQAKRASDYNMLVERVKKGMTGAKKAAQRMFGRNALVRTLGVKSPAMVTKSPEWQAMAVELKLDCKANRPPGGPHSKIGHGIAAELKADERGDLTAHDVDRRETVRILKQHMEGKALEETIEHLNLGKMTEDEAREMAKSLASDDKRFELPETNP